MEAKRKARHVRGTARAASRPHQIAKGRLMDGPVVALQNLLDHFRPQSKIQIPRNLMIALVAGACNHPNCLVLSFSFELIRLAV
jgi:hypothetical protein